MMFVPLTGPALLQFHTGGGGSCFIQPVDAVSAVRACVCVSVYLRACEVCV